MRVESSLIPVCRQLKQDLPAFHEMGHRILVWHHPYFYGDTAQTLDPDWQQPLEEEANYTASTLMFCGELFTTEARDTKPEWASVEELKKRYRKNLPNNTTPLRSIRSSLPDGNADKYAVCGRRSLTINRPGAGIACHRQNSAGLSAA